MTIFAVNDESLWVGGLEGTILVTENGGAIWEDWRKKKRVSGMKGPINHIYKIYEKKSGLESLGQTLMYLLCRYGQIYSQDGGVSWAAVITSPEVGDLLKRGWLYDMLFHPDVNELGWMVGKWGIVLRTDDEISWKRVN